MSQARVMRLRIAAHETNAAGRVDYGTPEPEIKHNASTYRAGKCKCTTCKADHNAKNKAWKAKRKSGEMSARRADYEARLAQAKAFMEDGASRNEAARSTRIAIKTLIRHYPELGTDHSEWSSIMGQVKNSPTLLKMHREIWDSHG